VQPLLQWRSSEYYTTYLCIGSLIYPACSAHAPYCHLWPAPFYNIFPLYLIKGKILEKKKTENKMCVFIFSINLSEIFFILRRNERDMIKYIYMYIYIYVGFHVKYTLFLSDFNSSSSSIGSATLVGFGLLN